MSIITLPAGIVGLVRTAAIRELGGHAQKIEQASIERGREQHPEWFAPHFEWFDVYRALLGQVGWGDAKSDAQCLIDLNTHRRALVTALESQLKVEKDYMTVPLRFEGAKEQRETAAQCANEIERFLAALAGHA